MNSVNFCQSIEGGRMVGQDSYLDIWKKEEKCSRIEP